MVAATKAAQKKAAGKERMRSARDTSVAAVGAQRPSARKVSPLGAAAHEAILNGAVVPAVAKARRKTAADDIAATGLNGATRKTAKVAAKSANSMNGLASTPGTPSAAKPKARVGKLKSVAGVATATPAPAGLIRPPYWDKACADLVKRDRIMKKLIPQLGPVHLMTRGDPFVTLARSVVGQQVSVPAAQAMWGRIVATCPKLTPAQFVKVGHEKLIGCGLSKRKTEYILDLAQHFVSGALHVDTWTSMDDEAVIAELTEIRGIGRWTAEMFLIFNLMRPDVLPLDDVGLIRAISVNYFSGEPVTRSEAREVAANWEPWRTVATWYMWRSLDPLPVAY
jgi:DNA-3-methyladenine glycosylase II